MKRLHLFILSFTITTAASAQKSMDTYLRIPIGMNETTSKQTLRQEWKTAEEYDTGVFCTWFAGSGLNDTPKNGSFRMLLYYIDSRIADKELRISATAKTAKPVFDSVKQTLIKLHGAPTIENVIESPVAVGGAKYCSWTFDDAKHDAPHRIDLAIYKSRMRTDYTITVACFTKQYLELFPSTEYLHVR